MSDLHDWWFWGRLSCSLEQNNHHNAQCFTHVFYWVGFWSKRVKQNGKHLYSCCGCWKINHHSGIELLTKCNETWFILRVANRVNRDQHLHVWLSRQSVEFSFDPFSELKWILISAPTRLNSVEENSVYTLDLTVPTNVPTDYLNTKLIIMYREIFLRIF